jgi:site-specific DNA-adenine methylase
MDGQTLDDILAKLKEMAETKQPVDMTLYLDAAAKMLILLQDLDEELVDAQMTVANAKAQLITDGKSVSASQVIIEATPHYRTLLTLKAKRERIGEFIRVCKKRTEINNWER